MTRPQPSPPRDKKHIKDTHDNKSFKCSRCDVEEKTENDLNKHIENTHSSEESFNCTKCDYKTKTRNELSYHIADIHDIDIRQNRRQNKNKNSGGQTREICAFWNRGFCKFGDKCFRAHEESPYCYFQEKCVRKSTCKFFHADLANNFLDIGRNQWYHM